MSSLDPVRKFVVTGLGSGYVPWAPGTWGSGVSCVLFLAATWASGANASCVASAMAVVAVLASVACVGLGRFAETAFGKKDPRQCTIDEVAGQAVTFLLVPLGAGWREWLIVAAVGFFFFRLFDIIKPPPARQMEKYPYGWGVLLDDLMAGIYANIATQAVVRLGIWICQ